MEKPTCSPFTVYGSSFCAVLAGTALLFACGSSIRIGENPSPGGNNQGGDNQGGNNQGGDNHPSNNPSPTATGGAITLPTGGTAPELPKPAETTSGCDNNLRVVIRDFRGWAGPNKEPKHPDFENVMRDDPGIVADVLGQDQKPVYNPSGSPRTVKSADTFNQWYRDVDGVNMRLETTLTLTPSPTDPGVKIYDNQEYYPIDDQLFGNQNQTHNYSFTTEIHTSFTYKGGERFTFIGDDDVFVYVNGKLAIDLGGVHTAKTGTIDFDQQADSLGLVIGQTYPMDIFQAERHTSLSTFRIETKFDCLKTYIIP